MPPTPDPDAVPGPALAAGLARAWALLATAVSDRSSGLRLPMVATVRDGNPDARVMVLRAVDHGAGTITVYSDLRAAKIAEIAAAPAVVVAGYDAATRLQLRLTGTATVANTGASVDAAWTALTPVGRRAYQSTEAPGTPLDRAPSLPIPPPDGGRANFAVITIVLDRIEWLELAEPAHLRAAYDREPNWRGTWLVP